jgi:hypothetical protein
MKAYQAWYSCYEEHGTFGYFTTREAAERCAEQNKEAVGTWTEYGDSIQKVGVSEIDIQEAA